MKRVLSFSILFCLIIIIALQLYRNKQTINARIEFAEREVEAYPVKAEQVTFTTLDKSLEVAGILSAQDDIMMMAETQGRVKSVFKKSGEWVKKGEPIAQIDDALMRSELLVTESNYEKAQKDLQRANTLREGGAITQQQLEGLQLQEKAALAKYNVSKKRVNDALVKAPISGYINKLFISEGGMVGGAVPICELVNTNSMKIQIKVSEEDVVNIKPGDEVDIFLDALKFDALQGQVMSVAAKADYALQYEITVVLTQIKENSLKAGMVARVKFTFKDLEQGAVINENSVVNRNGQQVVFIIEEDKATMKPVRIDYTINGQVKLVGGVQDGDLLITSGMFNLQDKTKIRLVE